ncbi:MAG: hypothetical protein A2297_04185 [Elusimicrobia bacterium RIFOXYB2_FULL_48_7]|nr:MAG: hypothetical protein A2297_04185 [Elusimicrobia bacterium RIFOXYB2_FULL_48_7]
MTARKNTAKAEGLDKSNIAFSELKKTLEKLVDKRKPIDAYIYCLTVSNVKANCEIKEIFIPSENIAINNHMDLNVFRTDRLRYQHSKLIKKIGLPRDFVEQIKVFLDPKEKIKEILDLYLKD